MKNSLWWKFFFGYVDIELSGFYGKDITIRVDMLGLWGIFLGIVVGILVFG